MKHQPQPPRPRLFGQFNLASYRRVAPVLRSPVFLVGLALKLVFSALFASQFLTSLFVPFIARFVASPLASPYAAAWSLGEVNDFPYPAMMLYLVSWPWLLVHWLGLDALWPQAVFLLIRLPLLVADIGILLVLCRWTPRRTGQILWLYWASPVLFYITYMHGQLDVLPIALLFAAIHLLFKERISASALVYGLGIAAKTNLAIGIPFVCIYLWQNTSPSRVIYQYLAIVLAVFLAVNAPYLLDPAFVRMVLMNAEQQKVAAVAIPIAGVGLSFYVIPALFVGLTALALWMRIHNRDVFVAFLGFAFSIFLFFIPPAQGWYFWVVPLFVYFFARMSSEYRLLFVLVQASYLLYFALIPESDYLRLASFLPGTSLYAYAEALGLPAGRITSGAFTLLQTLLLLSSLTVFYRGVLVPQRFNLIARPFLLGIAGDSGAGKSTLADGLRALFNDRNVNVVCGDDMHKWQRGDSHWKEVTHLDPSANALHDEVVYLEATRGNRVILRRHYDHATGEFTEEKPIKPRSIMVWEGLHTFYLRAARDLFDLRVFVKPQESLAFHRKIVRDMAERGHAREAILRSIESRREDSLKYVQNQERYADVVVSLMTREEIADVGNPDVDFDEWLRFSVVNSIFLDALVEDLKALYPGAVRHYFDQSDQQVLEVAALPGEDELTSLAETHLEGLNEFGIYEYRWQPGLLGLTQLLLCYCIFYVAKGRKNA